MFSRRTSWSEEPNDLTVALRRRRARGLDVLDLTVSNPTLVDLAWEPAELERALASVDLSRYDPEPAGPAAARAAVADFLAGRGTPVPPDRLVLTGSTSEAYSWLLKLACDPGDEILAPAPSYPLVDHLAMLEGVRVRRFGLEATARGWRLVHRDVLRGLTGGARAVLVVHPNNPTGSWIEPDDRRFLAAACAEHGALLVSDEVFAAFAWPGDSPAPSLLSLGRDGGPLVAALSGLSKLAGLPQVKLSWIALAGPHALVSRAVDRLEWVGDTYLPVSATAGSAAAAILSAAPAFRRRALARLTANLAALDRAVAGSQVERLPASAGWTAVLRLPHGEQDEALALELLEEDGVLVHPGSFHDFADDRHVVVSLLVPTRTLASGAARLAARVAAGRA